MPNEELINYIKQNLGKGFSKEQITQALKEAGWQDLDVEEGFKEIEKKEAPSISPEPVQPKVPEFQPIPETVAQIPEKPAGAARRKMLNFKIILGVAVVLGLAFGGILYAQVWDPLWNPFRAEPEEILAEIVKSMEVVQTSRQEFNLALKAENKTGAEFLFNFKTDSDRRDPANFKSQSEFNFRYTVDGTELSLSGEQRTIGKASYIKLTAIPAFPLLEAIFIGAGVDLNQLKNQWIKIDEDSFKKLLGESLAPQVQEELKEQAEEQEKTAEKIRKLFENKELFLVREELPDKKISDTKVYHYIVALNKEEIRKMIPELLETVAQGQTQGIPAFGEEGLSKLEEEINKFFEKVGDVEAQIWIGKKDKLIYKILAEKEIDLSKLQESAEGKIVVKLEINNSNFNIPLEIEPPEDYKTFEETFGALLSNFLKSLGESREKAREARRMADMRQISLAMEMYYDDNNSRYLQSKVFPDRIGNILPQIFNDPGSGPCPSYQWISNLGNSQKYCAWACLESGEFFAVSPKGSRQSDAPPRNLDCW